MPRITVQLSKEQYGYLEMSAERAGFSSQQEYLRQLLREQVESYEDGLTVIYPGPTQWSTDLHISLPGPLARQLAIASERLGYSSYSDIIRAILQQAADPFAQTAQGYHFPHGPAFSAAIASGEVAVLTLREQDYRLSTVLHEIADRMARHSRARDKQVAGLLHNLAVALTTAEDRQRAPAFVGPVVAPALIERLTTYQLIGDATYKRTGYEHTSIDPHFAPEEYLAKFPGFFEACIQSAMGNTVSISSPAILGSNAAECFQSLSLAAEARCWLAISYDHQGSNGYPTEYRERFSEFHVQAMVAKLRQEQLLIACPDNLGDSYDEILCSLSLLAREGITLGVMEPQPGAYSLRTLAGLSSTCPTSERAITPLIVASHQDYVGSTHNWELRYPRIGVTVEARFQRLVEMHEMGRYDDCGPGLEEEYRLVLGSFPEFLDAYHHLAMLLSDRAEPGDEEEAFSLWKEAVARGLQALPPEFKIGLDRLPWHYLSNRPFLRAYRSLGLQYLQRGQHDQATQTFETIYALNPNDNQGVRSLLVDCYLAQGRPAEVLRLCAECEDDTDPAILYGRVLANLQLGQRSAAGKALQIAIQYCPRVAQEIVREDHSLPEEGIGYYITCGGADEAFLYWEEQGSHWESTAGAIEFLHKRLVSHPVAAAEVAEGDVEDHPVSTDAT